MSQRLRSWKALAPALTVLLVLTGATAVAAHRHHHAPAAGRTAVASTPDGSPTGSPTSESAVLPTPARPTPKASSRPSTAASLGASAKAKSAALARLAEKVQADAYRRRHARPVAEFTMASFNIQGATHRGDLQGRTRRAVDLLQSHHVDVVGLQEFQRPQRAIFARIAGGTYDVFPGTTGRSLDAENSVAWRRDTFTLVTAETRPYPYFKGAIRNMPRVLLRNRRTGVTVWVTSYHNPATCCGYGNAAGFRARAVAAQVRDADNLVAATGTPLIVSGDMNDRARYFCAMAHGTGMHSADGSTDAGGCRVAPHPWIDWIMGTPQVEFSGYTRDRSAFVRRTTDHPVVVVHARVTGKPGEGRYADGAGGG